MGGRKASELGQPGRGRLLRIFVMSMSVCDPVLIVGIQKRREIGFTTTTLINDNFVAPDAIGWNGRNFQLARIAPVAQLDRRYFELDALAPFVEFVIGSGVKC